MCLLQQYNVINRNEWDKLCVSARVLGHNNVYSAHENGNCWKWYARETNSDEKRRITMKEKKRRRTTRKWEWLKRERSQWILAPSHVKWIFRQIVPYIECSEFRSKRIHTERLNLKTKSTNEFIFHCNSRRTVCCVSPSSASIRHYCTILSTTASSPLTSFLFPFAKLDFLLALLWVTPISVLSIV